MSESRLEPINKDVHLNRPWLTMQNLAIGFLLFCSIVYLLAALRGLFPATRELALVGSLLVLIALVSLRAVIQLRVAPERLARVGAICLFLSFLTWEAPIDGFIIVVVSLLCLALAISCYLGCSLCKLGLDDVPIHSRHFLQPVIAVLSMLVGLTVIFLLMRSWLGWFLAMRAMLLVPAALLIYELRNKDLPKRGKILLVQPFFKQEWVSMGTYGFLLAGGILLLLPLVSGFIFSLQGQHVLQIGLVLLLFAVIFLLQPVADRHSHYLLSLGCILLMVVAAVLYADRNPVSGIWFLLVALLGLAISAIVQSLKKVCVNRGAVSCMRLSYVSVILALLVIAAYPLCHYAWGSNGFLLAPASLLTALLLSFFAGED